MAMTSMKTTSPVEADLVWSIGKRRRSEGGFIGADRMHAARSARREAQARRHQARRPRAGPRRYCRSPTAKAAPIGIVTSGGFGPTANGPVAMGYVETAFAAAWHGDSADRSRQAHAGAGRRPCRSCPTITNAEEVRRCQSSAIRKTMSGSASTAISPPSASPITPRSSWAMSSSSNCRPSARRSPRAAMPPWSKASRPRAKSMRRSPAKLSRSTRSSKAIRRSSIARPRAMAGS